MTDVPAAVKKVLELWAAHPAQMVRELFSVEPDPWQEEVLEAFPHNQRLALQACKGPGKTCVLAWIAWNFLLTRNQPKVIATSISADNLADGLWAEMAKWQIISPLLQSMFTYTKTRIFHKEFPDTWFMSARTWAKTADKTAQADTLAGKHADNMLFLLDESGGMTMAVLVSAEAALSSCIEGHIVQAGNPTSLEGPLHFASIHRESWYVVEITGAPDDPKRSTRISREWALAQIAAAASGEKDPWVMVNVFGKFPPSNINALIGMDDLLAASKRYYREHEIGRAARVLGVDVARFGDDSSVIFPRQGIQAFPPEMYRSLDSIQGASKVNQKIKSWKSDAAFVDDTGGYGSGWIDQLRQLGQSPIPICFSSSAHNSGRFANKRSEMYFQATQWVIQQGALPECKELFEELSKTTYTFVNDRLIIEPKAQIKAKLGRSPDYADAFILTFAEDVTPTFDRRNFDAVHQFEYDPFKQMEVEVA